MRAVVPLVAALVLVPLGAGSSGSLVIEEGSGDVTVAGWRGAPLVLGTDCATTDLVRATLTARQDGTAVTLRMRDVTEPCEAEAPGRQAFGFTLNLLLMGGAEAWMDVVLDRTPTGLHASGAWTTRCQALVPMPDNCQSMFEDGFPVQLDVATSTLSFLAPIEWEAIDSVWFTSVMWDCSEGHCVVGSFAGPGDRMPDVGTVAR